VVFCDYRDILTTARDDDFLGKPYDDLEPFKLMRGVDPDGEVAGVFFCKGKTWKDLRKFTVQTLGGLGMGCRDTMEAVIMQEAESLVAILAEEAANVKAVSVHHRFSTAINNVVWRLVTGCSTGQKDPQLIYLTQCINDMFDAFDPGKLTSVLQINYGFVYRWMKHLGLHTVPDYAEPMKEMIVEVVQRSHPNYSGYYIEKFLEQIRSSQDDAASTFYGSKGMIQLVGTAMDLFVAGTDTTSTVMEWCVAYLLAFPDVQARLREEVDEATGGAARPVSLSDKPRTPLVLSFLEEALRFCPMMYVNVPHITVRDTQIGGYFIPKGTQVIEINPKFNNITDSRSDREVQSQRALQR